MLISVRIHLCVKFFQNNSGSVEIIGGATIVSFFVWYFFHFYIIFFALNILKYLMNMCLLSEETFFKGVVHEQYWSSLKFLNLKIFWSMPFVLLFLIDIRRSRHLSGFRFF